MAIIFLCRRLFAHLPFNKLIAKINSSSISDIDNPCKVLLLQFVQIPFDFTHPQSSQYLLHNNNLVLITDTKHNSSL
jgi:hypothetical protein